MPDTPASRAGDGAAQNRKQANATARGTDSSDPHKLSALPVRESQNRKQANACEQPSLLLLQTQKEAVAYIQNQGYQVQKSKFSADLAAGHIAETEHGFEKSALMAYALAYCKPRKKVENSAVAAAQIKRLNADADAKAIAVARAQIKLQKERGELMEKSLHERELAARQQFFTEDIRTAIKTMAGPIITLVEGNEEKRGALIAWWREKWADIFDYWSQGRSFVNDEDDSEIPDDEES